MKIIFLDIDGVLLPFLNGQTPENKFLFQEIIDFAKQNRISRRDAVNAYSIRASFKQESVRLINKLCDKSGAKLVVISTWRYVFEEQTIMDKLVAEGIDKCHFHTQAFAPLDRGDKWHDVNDWARQYFPSIEHTRHFVTIDDQFSTGFTVHPRSETGFAKVDYVQALEYLNQLEILHSRTCSTSAKVSVNGHPAL